MQIEKNRPVVGGPEKSGESYGDKKDRACIAYEEIRKKNTAQVILKKPERRQGKRTMWTQKLRVWPSSNSRRQQYEEAAQKVSEEFRRALGERRLNTPQHKRKTKKCSNAGAGFGRVAGK